MATFKKVVTESADDTIAQSTTGSAATLTTGQDFSVTGDVTASAVSFNGSGGVALATTLADSAVVNAKIADNTIEEDKLSITNSASDGYVLSWDDGESDMKWVSQSVDLANLPDMTEGWTNNTDEFVVLDGGVQKRKRSTEIFGSNAFNSTAFTTNTGTVTEVGTGDGLTGTVNTSGNLSIDFSSLSDISSGSAFQAGDNGVGENANGDVDGIIVSDDGAAVPKIAYFGDIPVSFFNNDAGFTSNVGDITSVSLASDSGTAQDTSGAANFTISGGTGVSTAVSGTTLTINAAQDISTSADVSFANLSLSGDLTVSGKTITTNTETLEIADNTLILNSDLSSSSAGVDAGFVVERGSSGDNAAFFYDNSDASWKVGTSSTQALPTDGARVALQSVKSDLDTSDTSVPVGGFQIAGGVAYVRTS